LKTEAGRSCEKVLAKLCPVCGSDSLEPILRDVIPAAYIVGLNSPSVGALAYHCPRGHVFLLLGEEFGWEEPAPEGSGYAIFL
jgi:hypothetical protein